MKSFKSKTIKATISEFSDICISVGDIEIDDSIVISNKRTARALAKWLMKVTEPIKKTPPAEPRVGTKIAVTTQMDGKLWFNRPGVITGIYPSDAYPYGVDVSFGGGRVESMIFNRDEFKVRK